MQGLNDKICFFLRERFADMGEKEGGLYPYYVRRMKAEQAFSLLDKKIIDYVRENYFLCKQSTSILEVGGGIGQLGHALALEGYNITICERDVRRFNAAVALGDFLKSGAKLEHTSFPDCYSTNYDLVIMANVTSSENVTFTECLKMIKEKVIPNSRLLFSPVLYDTSISTFEEACNEMEISEVPYKQVGIGKPGDPEMYHLVLL